MATISLPPPPASVCVYLLDSVSGAVLHRSSHKLASGPVHLVLSENWVVVSHGLPTLTPSLPHSLTPSLPHSTSIITLSSGGTKWPSWSSMITIETTHSKTGCDHTLHHPPPPSTVWSSLSPSSTPQVLSQAYVVPTSLTTLTSTHTLRGITHKSLLSEHIPPHVSALMLAPFRSSGTPFRAHCNTA